MERWINMIYWLTHGQNYLVNFMLIQPFGSVFWSAIQISDKIVEAISIIVIFIQYLDYVCVCLHSFEEYLKVFVANSFKPEVVHGASKIKLIL